MKQVAKCLIFDSEGNILLLFRSDTHPKWPNEGDLPGGAVEEDEEITFAVSREIKEEVGIKIDPDKINIVYKRPVHDPDMKKIYYITEARVQNFTNIKLSWEHSKYKPIKLDELINDKTNHSTDNYFQTVLKYLTEKVDYKSNIHD